MHNRKTIYCILGLLVILLIISSIIISRKNDVSLNVVFLDVGQGDAILIEQGSTQVLIDGGVGGTRLLEKIAKYVPFWDRDIEMVIETHPDQDHIGGLAELFRTYNIKTVLKTDMAGTSQTFKHLEDLIAEEKSQVVEAKSGGKISFVNGAEASVLFPFDSITSANENDTNAASVVIKLTFGENSFLFTGDLPTEQEQEILEKIRQPADDLKSDILKVAHHGSKYASSDGFLDAVKPRDAIISVGKNNAYGHPSAEVLQRLRAHGAAIFRTDELGDIVYECLNMGSKCQMIARGFAFFISFVTIKPIT